MIDALLRAGMSNVCMSAALAVVAYAVQRIGRAPRAACLLWLVVLLRLLVPPVVSAPLVPWPGAPERDPPALAEVPAAIWLHAAPADPLADEAAPLVDGGPAHGPAPAVILLSLWIAGSAALVSLSLFRARKFSALLGSTSSPAPAAVRRAARDVARRIGLRRAPPVYVTRATVSPMVWWRSWRPCIYLPRTLVDAVERADLDNVLGHELAHVRRRDPWARLVEWLALSLFFWNPVVHWARRNLRALEEACCDAMAMEAVGTRPREYARSLLNALEHLSESAPLAREPVAASPFHTTPLLERRLMMILDGTAAAGKPAAKWLLPVLALTLPLGVAGAQDAGSTDEPVREAVKSERADGSEGARERLSRLGIDEKTLDRIEAALREAGVTDRGMDGALHALVDLVGPSGAGEKEHGLDQAQLGLVREIAARIRHARQEREEAVRARLESSGVSSDAAANVLWYLDQWGFDGDARNKALTAFARLVAGAKKQGDSLFDEPALFEKVMAQGLTAAQAEHVVALARRVIATGGVASGGDDKRAEKLAEVYEKLEALVEAGRISQDEARRKLAEAERDLAEHAALREAKIAAVRREIEAALHAGRITAEEARNKLAEIERKVAEAAAKRAARTADVYRKLEALVEAGRISQDEARRKLAEAERELAEHAALREARIAAVRREIEAALHAGRITAEEARNKLAEIERKLASDLQARARREEYAKVEAQILEAVAAGRIAPEDARKKLAEVRRRLFGDA